VRRILGRREGYVQELYSITGTRREGLTPWREASGGGKWSKTHLSSTQCGSGTEARTASRYIEQAATSTASVKGLNSWCYPENQVDTSSPWGNDDRKSDRRPSTRHSIKSLYSTGALRFAMPFVEPCPNPVLTRRTPRTVV
jgi:hypothetical protein